MVESVHALNNVHNQVGEANIILHDKRINRLWLDHVVHQVEPLGILQAALRQTFIGTLIIYSTTLERRGNGVRQERKVRCWRECKNVLWMQERKKQTMEMYLTHPVFVLPKSQHCVWQDCLNSYVFYSQ